MISQLLASLMVVLLAVACGPPDDAGRADEAGVTDAGPRDDDALQALSDGCDAVVVYVEALGVQEEMSSDVLLLDDPEEAQRALRAMADDLRNVLELSSRVMMEVPEAAEFVSAVNARYQSVIDAYELIDYDVTRLDATRPDVTEEDLAAIEIFTSVLFSGLPAEESFDEESLEAGEQALLEFAHDECGGLTPPDW